jgi:hypothetical protein
MLQQACDYLPTNTRQNHILVVNGRAIAAPLPHSCCNLATTLLQLCIGMLKISSKHELKHRLFNDKIYDYNEKYIS